MRDRLPLCATLLCATLSALPAAAQTTAAPPAAPATTAASRQDMAVEHRIHELHDKLTITPSEERPFTAFAEIMRENARRMATLVQARTQVATGGNAVEQMKSYADMARAHAEDMERLVPAFSSLYEALTPEQKTSADASFREFARGSRAPG